MEAEGYLESHCGLEHEARLIKVTTLQPGPGVVGPVAPRHVTNSDLRSIQSLGTAVSSVGDFDGRDDKCPLQVDLPPGVGLLGSEATVPIVKKGVAPPIDGLVVVGKMAR